MKKLYLFFVAIISALNSFGQGTFSSIAPSPVQAKGIKYGGPLVPASNGSSPSFSLKFPPLYQENFEGVTAPALPSNMTTTSNCTSTQPACPAAKQKWYTGTNTDANAGGFWPVPVHTKFAMTNDDVCDCNKSNDILELPQLNFTGQSNMAISFAAYNDGLYGGGDATVELNVNNGGWTVIHTMAKMQAWQDLTVLIPSSANNQSNVKLRFKWNDAGSWATGLAIDDIVVAAAPSNDLSLTKKYFYSTFDSTSTEYYTRIPLRQAQVDTVIFGADISNLGTTTMPNTKLTASVSGTATFSGTSNSSNLAAGATGAYNLTNFFIANSLGTYNVTFTANSDSSDSNPLNNTKTASYLVTDTIYSRDNSSPSGAFWYGAGQNYVLGNAYAIYTQDTATSISWFVPNFQPDGKNLTLKILDFGVNPPATVASSGTYTTTNADKNNWITLPITPTALSPGYYLAVMQSASDTVVFTKGTGAPDAPPLTSFVDPGITGTWYYGTDIYFIRLNTKAANPCTAVLSASITNVTCNGGANGAVNLTVTGATGPFIYTWNNGATTQNLTNVQAGSYSVTVSYGNGCTATGGPYNVLQPAPITISANASGTTCGQNNGTISTIVAGGTSPYTYTWSNGQTGASLSGLSPGNYFLTVTDVNGCAQTSSATINSSTGTPAPTAQSASSVAGNSFQANWNAVSGAINYFLDVATDSSFSNFASGFNNLNVGNVVSFNVTGLTCNTNYFYRVRVADACGTSTSSATVSVLTGACAIYCIPTYDNLCSSGDYINNFTFNTLSKLNSGCNGNANNYIYDTTVTTSVTKGSSYNISMQSGPSWSQGFGVWIDYNQNGSFADSGDFVYFSPSSGTGLFTSTVTIPTTALSGTTRLRVRCNYGGTLAAADHCTNLTWGETEDYKITIIAPIPCQNPPTAGAAVASPNAVCAGGTVFLSLSGNSTGTGQTYQWQSSPDNINFSNISGATNDTLTTSISAATHFRCVVTCGASANSSSVLVSVTSLSTGTASGPSTAIGNEVKTYSLSGSNGNITWQVSTDGVNFTDVTGASSNPQNLAMPGTTTGGTYYIRAKVSGSGCTDVFSNAVITVVSCATPYNNGSASGDFINKVIFNTINNSSTFNSLGGNVQDFKGTPGGTTSVCKGIAYQLTVSTDSAWTQGKAAWIDFNNNGSYADSGELVLGPTPTSVGAVSANVTIPLTAVSDTVKMRVICVYNATPNSNPCFAGPYGYGEIEEYSIIINPTPAATITANGPLSLCQGNSVTLTAGSGNTYSWNTGANTQSISVNSAGNYSVTVTGAGNCSSSDSVSVNIFPAPSVTATAVNTACGSNNGSATANASGGTSPYTYLWSNAANTQSISNLAAGTYFVTVSDANGCSANSSASVNSIGGPSLNVTLNNVSCNGGTNGSASAVASGGTSPYVFSWSNGQTTSSISNLPAGTYTVSVTDNNSCVTSSAVTISQPAAIAVSTSVTNINCNGGNNGSASASVSGGTTPYAYAWSNGQTAPTATGLAAGTYSVTITDSNNCTATASATVNQPSAFSATASSTNTSCNGGNNGTANATAAGGNGPYSYLWSNGQTSASISGLNAGNYSVTITDNNGCTASAPTTVGQPAAISLTTTSSNAACGQSNGSASVSASGGTGSLLFLWSNGQANSTATGLAAGTYFVTVTDANNCSNSTSAAVGNTGGPSVTVSATNVYCAGGSNGTANAIATGGSTPYSYSWSNGQTAPTATGLSAGNYSVTVSGNDGCISSSSVTVTAPSALVATVASVNVSCNGGNNGTATVTASGGTSPYSYIWVNGQTSPSATGLAAGSYGVTITDANNCTVAASANISQPTAITVTTTTTNTGCGSNTGSASASATGGTGGYAYLWSNNQTSATATGLGAGTYSVTVTDSLGCTKTSTASVSNIGAPFVTVSINNVSCNGGNNGSAQANATGGVTPYSYLWNNGQNSASANALVAGSYSVTVTDANGCITIASANITEPAGLSLTPSSVNSDCGLSNGSATATVAGGVSPYSYNWSNGQTVATVSGLAAGTYGVTVADANGCVISATAVISNNGAPTVTISSTNVNCPGNNTGSATATVTGGMAPYSFLWSNGQATASATGLNDGTYSLTVSDAASCMSITTVTITAANSAPNVNLGNDTASCGSIVLNAGSGFSNYLWNTGANSQTIVATASGAYSVTVTNSNGCSNSDAVNVSVNAAIPVNLGPDTLICIGAINSYTIDAGSGYVSYVWSDNSTGQTLTVDSTGIYAVTVTDANGCTTNDAVLVTFDPCDGIEGAGGVVSLHVFPNPAHQQINIGVVGGKELLKLTIISIDGRAVYAERFVSKAASASFQIDISGFAQGIYMLKVEDERSTIYKRIVVE